MGNFFLLFPHKPKANTSQKPATSKGISKKRSETRKTTSRKERKKHEEMAKHHKPKHPKGRRSGPKQSLPPFFLFMAQHRPGLQKSNPYWTAVETVKKLGTMWHEQPEKDKEMYKEEKHGSGHEPETARKGAHSRKISKHKGGNEDFDGLLC
uniref:HMG box domain-containing protein n=1 Tax=Buteo japonicus TaxID=224669 RepID=A0A8C0AN17_9AVES